MSAPSNQDPRLDQAGASDDSLLSAHTKLLEKQKDEKGNYRLMPLALLFIFSGLIFAGGTYLGHYAGMFDPRVFDEHGLPPKARGETAKLDPREVGKKWYNNAACNTCHQVNGVGVPGVFPPLNESEWVTGSPERLIRIVLFGAQGPMKVKGVEYPGTAPMPSFGKVTGSGYNWPDDRIAAVLTYIRSDFGNNAPAITPEQVAAIRAKEGDRKAYTQEELLKVP